MGTSKSIYLFEGEALVKFNDEKKLKLDKSKQRIRTGFKDIDFLKDSTVLVFMNRILDTIKSQATIKSN